MPDSHTIVAFMNNIFMTTICDDLIFHSAVDGKRALSQCIYIYAYSCSKPGPGFYNVDA